MYHYVFQSVEEKEEEEVELIPLQIMCVCACVCIFKYTCMWIKENPSIGLESL